MAVKFYRNYPLEGTIAVATNPYPAFGLSALCMLRYHDSGSLQRSEEQLQAHRAMPEGEAYRPERAESINATISWWELEDEQWLERIAWFKRKEAAAMKV